MEEERFEEEIEQIPVPPQPPEEEPEQEQEGDGLSDLFKLDEEDILGDIDERTELDVENDVVDGPLDDLTDVTQADIMGTPPPTPPPKSRYKIKPTGRIYRRPPMEGMSGMR